MGAIIHKCVPFHAGSYSYSSLQSTCSNFDVIKQVKRVVESNSKSTILEQSISKFTARISPHFRKRATKFRLSTIQNKAEIRDQNEPIKIYVNMNMFQNRFQRMIFTRNLRSITSCILQNHRRLNTTPIFQAKIYIDRENSHAHEVLASCGQKYNIFKELSTPPILSTQENDLLTLLKSNKASPSTVIKDFQFIASYCKNTETCISEDRFDQFVDNFTSICHEFSDSQLLEALELLTLLPATESVRSKNFLELWSALDRTCVEKADGWNINYQLKVADAWYALNLAKLSEYVWLIIKKAGRRIRKLSPTQLVHVMFFCNVTRKSILGEMIDFEMNMKKIVDQLTIDEISVMSMGFFKTKTPLRDVGFIEYIFKRLTSEISTIGDISLVSLLKILR